MSFQSIPILFATDHQRHAPLDEFDQGALIPYREAPERVEVIFHRLVTRGLCQPIPARRTASIEDCVLTHTLEMLDFLEAAAYSIAEEDRYLYADSFPIRASMARQPRLLAGRFGMFCSDPYSPIGRGTWQAATAAAGLALQGAEMLLRQEAACVYALGRPPGHHAGPDFFGSYCYLNNAALAAQALLTLGRVAVLDIDYHHGNGTQAIFWNEPRILYASLHIDPHWDFPYFSGYADETGGPRAPGSTHNLPLPPGTTASGYLSALDAALQTVHAFQPAALVVSLGYDPYQGDPLSAFRVEASAYTAIGRRIGGLRLPTLLVQEGGYAIDALPTLAENFVLGIWQGSTARE